MSRVVSFGEIMMRLNTPGYSRFSQAMPGSMNITFAGAEANISASLAFLGIETALVTALPNHAIADACLADLRRLGVQTKHIVRSPLGRMGLYFYEQGVNQRSGHVIYDREQSTLSLLEASAYDWNRIFEDCQIFVISGITPALSSTAAEVTKHAIQMARQANIRVVCDLNFRSKLWRWDKAKSAQILASKCMTELMRDVDICVCGIDDAVNILGVQREPELRSMVLQMIEKFPQLSHVALTLRDGSSSVELKFGGALYDAHQQALHVVSPYSIPLVVDRLGAGDAFTAGIIFGLIQDFHAEQMIHFATAAGCLAHSTEGDYHCSTRLEIESVMHGDSGGRVIR